MGASGGYQLVSIDFSLTSQACHARSKETLISIAMRGKKTNRVPKISTIAFPRGDRCAYIMSTLI